MFSISKLSIEDFGTQTAHHTESHHTNCFCELLTTRTIPPISPLRHLFSRAHKHIHKFLALEAKLGQCKLTTRNTLISVCKYSLDISHDQRKLTKQMQFWKEHCSHAVPSRIQQYHYFTFLGNHRRNTGPPNDSISLSLPTSKEHA